MMKSGSAKPRSEWCCRCHAAHLDELLKLSASENVEATVIGYFGTDKRELILQLSRNGSRPDVDGFASSRDPDADAEGGR